MGGSSGSGSSDNTVRYAEYFEGAHKAILNHTGQDVPSNSVIDAFNAAFNSSPYGGAANVVVRDAFFTSGYVIENYPSLWDMFGKFMAGVDVHVLWAQTFNGISTSPEINAAVAAQAAYLDDDINSNVLTRFHAGMRNINAVQSSAFINGRALIEDGRVKAINKFASEIRLRALDLSADMWKAHLKWNESVISTFTTMFKLYYATELDVDKQKMDMADHDARFNLSLFEYVRAMLGVVSGAQGTVPPKEASTGAKALSGALGGASMGAAIGGPWGAAAGAVLGLGASFL